MHPRITSAWIAVLLALGGVWAAPPAKQPADMPPAKPSDAPPPKASPRLQFDKSVGRVGLDVVKDDRGKRVNGARLRVAAKQVTVAESNVIRVTWKLDYNGRRPPLTILAPTFDNETDGQTEVMIYASVNNRADDGISWGVKSPPWRHDDILLIGHRKDWFIEVPAGTTASGTLDVPVAELKKVLLKEWPEGFVADAPPAWVYVRLYHKPRERAPQWDLDAWTGDLQSDAVTVELSKW